MAITTEQSRSAGFSPSGLAKRVIDLALYLGGEFILALLFGKKGGIATLKISA